MGSTNRRVRLLNGVPIDEDGNPLPPGEQTAYFAQNPRPRPVESDLSSPWDEGAQGAATQGGADSSSGAGGWPGAQDAPQRPYAGVPQSAPGASPEPAPSSGKAVAAIVCGALAIFFSSTVLVGLALGIVALVLAASAAKGAGGGKAVVGRVLGVIAIVLSSLTLLSAIAVGAFSFSFVEDIVPSDSPSSYGDFDYDAEEQAVHDLAAARLDELCAMNDDQIAALGARLDEDFRDFTDSHSYTDIGVDPTEVARWLCSDMSYAIDSAYAFPEDGDGSVYATVVSRDYYSLLSEYAARANEFLSSEEAATLSDEEGFARLGEIMRDCLGLPGEKSEYYVSVEFAYRDGAWEIDEEDWQEEIDYIFWLF